MHPESDDEKPRRGGKFAKGLLNLGLGLAAAETARRGGAGPLLRGVSAGVRSLEQSDDRKHKRQLEDLLTQDRLEDRRDRREQRSIDRVVRDARLRNEGYIPESERGPDGEANLSGPTLDALIAAGTGGMPRGQPDIRTPKRYGDPVGGYAYDRMSPAAREDRARAKNMERLAGGSSRDRVPSFSERNTTAIQERIDDLLEQGFPLDEANRRARLEAGGSVSSASRTRPSTGESPEVRDNRRAAERNRLETSSTRREISALKRELGQYPADTPENKQKKTRLRQLETRADSLQSEVDKYSTAANRAALGGQGARADSSSAPSQLQKDLADAERAYRASLNRPGADSASVTQRYERLKSQIRSNHDGR